jgi:HEPN pEK499 p136
METKHFRIDFVQRTMANVTRYRGKFEFTNLLNCTLGLIILPYEKGIKGIQQQPFWSTNLDEIPNRPTFQIHRFEPIKSERDGNRIYYGKTLEVLLRKIRNGLAHQNVQPLNQNGQFECVEIKNYFTKDHQKRDDPDLHIRFSEKELEDFALFIANEYLKLYFVVGQEYITGTITRNLTKKSGRRCSILEIFPEPASRNCIAQVRYADTNRLGRVKLSDLTSL